MKNLIKILTGLFLISLILVFLIYRAVNQSQLKVYFFNVGQGDGILIRTPSHQNIVIDGGPDNSFITKLGQHLPFYDRQIDLMVLTHPHDDHLFGLVEILKRYKVKQVLASGVLHTTDAYLEWLKLIKDKNIPFKIALNGQEFVFENSCQGKINCRPEPVMLKVVYPYESLSGRKMENLNQSSVVTQLVFNQTKILFTGDLEKAGEEEILSHQTNIESAVIKVAHHGSLTSSSDDFLKAVKPKSVIISVGLNNKFGHPSPLLISYLTGLGLKIYRTDLLGDIRLLSDGQKIEIE
jgi:competence protein ComEC